MAHAPSHLHVATGRLSVPIGRRCCAGCARLVERRLLNHPHVVAVQVDPANEIATVEAHVGRVSVAELAELAGECCGKGGPVPMPDAAVSSHHHGHTADLADGTSAVEARAIG